MSAKSIYHPLVIEALQKDGWTITHDPLTISYGGKDLFVDLGAERLAIGAEKGEEKIAVEIQSFLSPSPVRDLQEAVGQFEVYQAILEITNPSRRVYLAVPTRVKERLLEDSFGKMIVQRLKLRFIIFDENQAKIIQWIN